MQPDEAVAAAKKLAGLFPKMNKDEFQYWAQTFQGFAREPVENAIMKYADRYSDFVDRQSFKTVLQAESGLLPTAAQRLEQEKAEAARRKHAIEADRVRCDSTHARTRIVLSDLSDGELQELKQAVIIENPASAEFLKSSDPRKGLILRAMMAELLKKIQRAPK